LLCEEMQTVVASHEYKARWWRQRGDGLDGQWPSLDHAEGARAYMSEHTAMHEALIARCRFVWARNCKMHLAQGVTRAATASPEASNESPDDFDSSSGEKIVQDTEIEYSSS
jgi:hypothetical protein